MGLYRAFLRYKRILQALFFVNIFFIVCGAIAVVQYASTHELSLLTIVAVGLGTLTFGILVPVYIIGKLAQVADKMRAEAEKGAARLLAGWLENYRDSEDPLRDPHFWLNITLILVELIGPQFNHPMGKIVADFAPFIKTEINRGGTKPSPKKSHRKTNPD